MRNVTFKVEGRTYSVPEMWFVGMTRRMTYQQAAQYCHEQQLMSEQFERQNKAAA